MARLARVEVFSPDEIAICHVMNRTVRRCFLMGNDPLTGKNYDHRKLWVEIELKRLAARFGIDLLCHAILSNHFHLVLRSRPDVVAQWNDTEVARRWLMLCPFRKDASGLPEEPTEFELNTIRKRPRRLAEIRSRLSDISWWMRLLSQKVAQRANRADDEVGKFWQARYRAVRLLDETAILACAAYVDLNPIRAAMAETLEQSDFTSVQRRLEALQESLAEEIAPCESAVEPAINAETNANNGSGIYSAERESAKTKRLAKRVPRDAHLSPLTIDELRDALGANCSASGYRASDKGFLPLTVASYAELLDWTARTIRGDKRGSTPASALPIFERLGIRGEVWCELVTDFGRLFYAVAGQPCSIDACRSRKGHRRYKGKVRTRELLAAG